MTPIAPAPVSAIILTRNEENRIAECLQSVAWARERLVIDDGSADRTVEIAQSLGARVLRRKMDVEGTHRNWAHAQAAHEWVLSIDADERVTPELAEEIQALLQGTPDCDIYSIPRRNYIGRRWIRHGGWYPSPQVKLFRPAFFQWEETTVHPRALSSSSKPWGRLRNDLIHYSYRDLSDFTAKTNRHTTQEARKWMQDGRKMPLTKGLWRTWDRAARCWWMKDGRKDGRMGLIIAVYAGLYQFLSYAKYWHLKHPAELAGKPEGPHPGSPPAAPADRLRLSAVILAKNAAVTFQSCLDSLRWVDDLVVVDGGSTDGTVAMAQAASARVVTELDGGDFGRLRNLGTDHANGDWILQLDADEVVTEPFRQALEKILRNPADPNGAYKFRRSNFFLGRRMRFGGWEHDSLHLFRKGRARYEGLVHEKLLVNGPVGRLSVGVRHYPFRSLEEFLDRQNRYTTLEAQEIIREKGIPSEREFRYQMGVRPRKLFWKLYVRKGGFREGRVGLIFCVLFSFVHFLKWAKAWEYCSNRMATT